MADGGGGAEQVVSVPVPVCTGMSNRIDSICVRVILPSDMHRSRVWMWLPSTKFRSDYLCTISHHVTHTVQ